jgi:DNA-binding transcriptional regulator YiaG
MRGTVTDGLGAKIQNLRENVLRLSRVELALLLDVRQYAVGRWEEEVNTPSPCMQRLLIFLEERPEEGMALLSQRPEPLFEGKPWSEVVYGLLGKLNMTIRELSTLLDISPSTVNNWLYRADTPEACQRLMLWLVYRYSDVDLSSWPSILRALPSPVLDVIAADRIVALRKSFGVTQRDFANVVHVDPSEVSHWERGQRPGWCANLLLRMLENAPGEAFDLLTSIPWREWELTPEAAKAIRTNLNLSQTDLARLLAVNLKFISDMESEGTVGKKIECVRLLYRLLEAFPKETVSLIQALPKSSFILQE